MNNIEKEFWNQLEQFDWKGLFLHKVDTCFKREGVTKRSEISETIKSQLYYLVADGSIRYSVGDFYTDFCDNNTKSLEKEYGFIYNPDNEIKESLIDILSSKRISNLIDEFIFKNKHNPYSSLEELITEYFNIKI